MCFCSELFLLNHNFQLIFCKKVNIFSKNSYKFFLLNNTCSITLALNICQCRPGCAKRMKISCRSLCRINLVACGGGLLTHLLKLKLGSQPSPCFTPLVNYIIIIKRFLIYHFPHHYLVNFVFENQLMCKSRASSIS